MSRPQQLPSPRLGPVGGSQQHQQLTPTTGSTSRPSALHQAAHRRDRRGDHSHRAHDRRGSGVVDPCWDYVRQYVGVDESSWVPWGDDVAMPSKADVADGASWLRCDAVFPRTWSVGFTEVRTTSVTAEGLADEPPSDFLACLNEPPTRMQPFIP